MHSRFPLTFLAAWILAVSAALTSAIAAQSVGGQWGLTWKFDGLSTEDYLGHSVSGAGDVNGDGFSDVIVGAYRANPGGLPTAGSAYVYSGATGVLLWQFDGQSAGDEFGTQVSGAGDVDGDGFHDLIVGAPSTDPGGRSNAGSAYIYSGATGALLGRFDGQNAYDSLGYSVSRAGDVDGDGVGDVIVGAPGADPGGLSGAGSMYIFSGATGLPLWQIDGASAYIFLGNSVSGAGDVDGDGLSDWIVGVKNASPGGIALAGSAYVYSGAAGSLLWQFDGQNISEHLGAAVSGAGDVDGDGFDDLIVGAPANQSTPGNLAAGSVYVYSGATGTPLQVYYGESANDSFGNSVSEAGDVDGDGFDDVLVGAWFAGGGAYPKGSAYVYSGITGSLIRQFVGPTSGSYLGCSVSGAGDVDGNGFGDLIIGARGSGGPAGSNGSAYVVSLDPYLLLAADEIHLSGSPVEAGLAFPAAEAGQPYSLLISLSGSGPSIFGGLQIPLTIDSYFYQWLGNPALTGALNANAKALHSLHLPPSTPTGAIGITLHLAAVTYDSATQMGRVSSAVRYLTIVP